VNDAMDIHGGKGICLDHNWIGRGYQMNADRHHRGRRQHPDAALIIFGQGAIRCHPYVLREMRAAKEMQGAEASREFGRCVHLAHSRHVISNGIRGIRVWGWCQASLQCPKEDLLETRHYYRQRSRLSAAFAFLADISMMAMGGALKRKGEDLRPLGDILSMMYLVSATLKRYEGPGPPPRRPARWCAGRCAMRFIMHSSPSTQILSNFPSKALATLLPRDSFPRAACRSGRRSTRATASAPRSRWSLDPGATGSPPACTCRRGESDATGVLEAAFVAAVALRADRERSCAKRRRRGSTIRRRC